MELYKYLEDKWYDLIEKLDTYLPVTKIVDRIDKVVPSFILFLILVLFLIIGLLGLFFAFTLNSTNQIELVVLSSTGLPLGEVNISAKDDCSNELFLSTDDSGKVIVTSCSLSFDIVAQKNGYKKYDGLIEPEDGKAVIRLAPIAVEFSVKEFYSKIVDITGETIIGANLEVICVSDNNKTYLENQTPDGFNFNLSTKCNPVQLKATAAGYQEKTISVKQIDERAIITLEEIDLRGKVNFMTANPSGDESGVEITYTNLDNSLRSVVFTDNEGYALVELGSGDYSYVAVSKKGQIMQGSFSIEAKQIKDVVINFPAPADTSDYISIRVVSDVGSPLSSAKINFYKDGNYVMQKITDSNGTFLPIPIVDNNSSTKYHVFVSAVGYEGAILPITVRKLSAGPYEIKLRQGGAKLNVKVIDDLNIIQKDAGVALTYSELNLFLFSKVTDSNGTAVFSDLPAGEYSLRAVDSSGKAEATLSTSVVKDATKNVLMVVVTGEGKVRFKFLNSDYGFESPSLKLFEVKNNSKFLLAQANAKAGVYETSFLKAGTKIFVEINDENFISMKSIVYEVTRRTQDKEIYLVRADKLPNDNKVLMKLMQVYSSNPLYGTPTKATQILAGSSYYLEFLTIVNNENDSWLVSDFYVGPKDKNTLDTNQVATIGGIYSIVDSLNLLSIVRSNLVIDSISEDLVESGAKQGNSQLSSLQGKSVVPVILKVDVDVNKIGDVDVFFRALHGNDTSLLYKKSFTIGQRFCLTDCPIFLFSNYIQKESEEFIPVSDESFLIRVGDEYILKTIVNNSTDTDFGNVGLLWSIPKESIENMLFVDKNSFSANISLLPLGNASVQTTLTPIKVGSASEKIIQTVEKISGGVNLFKDYEGNNNTIRFSVKAKEQLEIAVSPVSIDEKVSYPMFLVKTKYKGKKPVSSHWNARKINAEGYPVFEIANGTTDVNGIQILSFDATSLSKGDKVRFTAYDDNGALDGFLDVVVSSSVPQTIPPIYECLTPKIDGVDLFENPNHYVRLMKEGGVSIVIESNCNEDRVVHIHTDLLLSETQFTVPANSSKTIILNAKPRGELLGVYPVQILTLDSSRYTQLALTDVEIFGDDCFDLSQAVFDMTFNNQVEAKVTNKCFSGRKDNFYPKMDISTKSVGLTYNKPGNPEKISFTATVIGSAVEAYVLTYGWAKTLHQKSSGDSCNSKLIPEPAPEEFYYAENGEDICSSVIKEIRNREATQKEEPDIPATDPAVPFYTLPPTVQRNIISEIFESSGSSSSISGVETSQSNYKIDKASFSTMVEGIKIDYNPNKDDPSENGHQYYPGQIGNPLEPVNENCSLLNTMQWVPADTPEGYGSCGNPSLGDDWSGANEESFGMFGITRAGSCSPCDVESFGLVGESSLQGYFYTHGSESSGFLGTGLWSDSDSANLMVQPEFYRTITFMKEMKKVWTKDFNILTSEGAVQNLGRYDAVPVPKWTRTDEMFGHEEDDAWEDGDLYMALICAQGMGFIPPETAQCPTGAYDVEDYNSPLIEYDSSGMVKYYIPRESIPANTRAFLKNGRYYVEYFGAPEVASPDINFTLTKSNLLGSEYAILTVQDWTGGNTKSVKQFQVKLNGPPSNCYSSEGVVGFTGEEFVPRLLFNWDWNSIAINQCDMRNENYTYCDATQFTISLFKKLVEIQDLVRKNNLNELSLKTGFYAYLIKDNYSAEFLEDFDTYYSTNVSNAASYFNSTSTIQGYDQFISRGMLSFTDKNTNSSLLSFGGLYRVEINLEFVNESLFSLFDNNVPNVFVKVVMVPVQQPENNNPFYETPFDGEVGRTQDSFVRKDYGTSLVGDELKLNAIINSRSYDNSLVQLNSSTNRNLQVLQNAPILYYKKGEELRFNPSQPTPVIMTIKGLVGPILAKYTITGTGSNTAPNKEWKIISSTINSGGVCGDFENNAKIIFTENAFDEGVKGLSWNAQKAGTIGIATTFFTPKEAPVALKITPQNEAIVALNSYPNLKTGTTAVVLSNYDYKFMNDYDTIEGLLKMLGEEKVCMSQNSEEILRMWWNPDYLNAIIREVNTNRSYSCK